MRCPRCKTSLPTDASRDWFPFCSRRCQLIDLGAWLEEKHRIPQEEPADFAEGEEDKANNRH